MLALFNTFLLGSALHRNTWFLQLAPRGNFLTGFIAKKRARPLKNTKVKKAKFALFMVGV